MLVVQNSSLRYSASYTPLAMLARQQIMCCRPFAAVAAAYMGHPPPQRLEAQLETARMQQASRMFVVQCIAKIVD